MSADNPAAPTSTRRSTRTQRNDSTSSSSHAATPAVPPTIQVMDSVQESFAAAEKSKFTVEAIFGSGSDLSDLSDSDKSEDEAEDNSPASRAASASPIPRVPLPKRPSPRPSVKARKARSKDIQGELPVSSSGSNFGKRKNVVVSDEDSDHADVSKAEKEEMKAKGVRRRTSPKDAVGPSDVKSKPGNQRERQPPRGSRPRGDVDAREDRTKEDEIKTLVPYHPDDDGKRNAIKKDDIGSKPLRLKLNVKRPESQQLPDKSETTIQAESSTSTRPRAVASNRSNQQQKQQQSSRKISDSKEDLRDNSSVTGDREGESKMGKRSRPKTDDDGEYDQPRARESKEDRRREGGDLPRKRQKDDRFANEEARDSHSDRDAKRLKNPKSVRMEIGGTESRKRTSAEHASLSANKTKPAASESEWFSTSQGPGGRTPREGGGKATREGGKTPQERGGKTPKTPYSTEPERSVKPSEEDGEGRNKIKSKEEKQQDMVMDTDDENVSAIAERKPAIRRPTNDNSTEKPSSLSQPKKIKKDYKQEDDDSDRERDERKQAKFSQSKLEDTLDQQKKKKKKTIRTTQTGDSMVDASSDIEINLGDTQQISDKPPPRKKEDVDIVMVDDEAPGVKPKPQKRPGGEKTVKRVAELAGTGMGPRTPAEGKPRSSGESAAGAQPRRPGLQPAAKKSHYDPLGSALSSLPGIGPGLSSGASQVQLNSMSSGLLIQEYEDRPKPWRIRGTVARDDVTGKNTIAAVRAILEMRNNGSFKS
ncbi:hypothetical protein QFC21_007289 [Naganishia friedmannii]|uniref:Uncharacterized protein n=1 Tax=Naganishia friedmannii TaxID=89922 RepID=A0ACC2UXM0_9TREE|nr:hypothetical protein QFC21_007289 [Naganishia friedmannii]